MGFPHPTVDIPGHHPGVAALAGDVTADPFGAAARLQDGCRGGRQPAGHLCVTNWVLAPACASVVLVWHARLGWAVCGGHVQAGEHPHIAARRELVEETGLSERDVRPLGRPLFVHCSELAAGPAHVHWNIAYGWVATGKPDLVGEPGAPAAWFPLGRLPQNRPGDGDDGFAVLVAAAAVP